MLVFKTIFQLYLFIDRSSHKHLLLIRLCVIFLVSITTVATGYCEQFGWLRGISVKWGREGVMETIVEGLIISFHTFRGGVVSDYEELYCCIFIPALAYIQSHGGNMSSKKKKNQQQKVFINTG